MKQIRLLLVAFATMFGLGSNAQTWTGNSVEAGTFFLYNVGAEKFLNNGDPNQSWGTNAYLQADFGLDVVLELNNGAYNINTNIFNNSTDHYLATTTWTDGAPTAWTFTETAAGSKTYTISNGSSYLVANDALNDVVYGALTNDEKSYWKLVSLEDFKAAMQAKTYSATDPMDVSVFIKGRSFARNDKRNDSWSRTYTNGNNQKWIEGSDGSKALAEGKYYGNEFWNQTFDIHQDITGLPEGTYEVKCSGFGTNGTTVIYGNTKEGTLTTENAAANGSRFVAYKLIADENAWAGQTTGPFNVYGGNLTVGLKRVTNQNADWCVYDEFRLYYYGLDLTNLVNDYHAALSAAQNVDQSAIMSNDALNALNTALGTYDEVNENDADALQEAITALTTATENCNASIAAYANVPAYLAKMGGVLETTNVYTQDSYNTWYGNIQTQYEARTLSDIDAVNYTETTALGTGWHSANHIDDILLSTWTVDGVICSDYSQPLYINTWSTEGNTDGSDFHTPFFEYWVSQENVLAANTFVCTLTGLEEETVYTFSLRARVRQTDGDDSKIPNGVTMTVGTNTVDISAGAQFQNGPFYIGNFSAAGQTDANGTLTVTITVAADSYISWLSFNNCNCTEGEDLSTYIADYQFALGQITTALNDDIYGETAESYFNDVLDDYEIPEEDLNTASKDELITSTEAFNAIIGAYAAFVAPLRGSSIDGWDGGVADNTYQFHVNGWSSEGQTDGSNMIVPFIEYWTNKTNQTLVDNTMSHVVTGLEPNAYYKVSGLVRTLNEAGTVSEDGESDPMGTFIFAGAGIARAYANAHTATHNGNDYGVYANPVVYGQADAEGNLTIGIKTIKTNCNWVSWKNITVVKESDELTDGIAAALVAEARDFSNNLEAQETEDAATGALTNELSDANYAAAGAAIEAAYRVNDITLANLTAAIAAAQTKLETCTPLGFMPDEYAPYNVAPLAAALATAQDFAANPVDDQDAIDAATTALTTATDAVVANTEEVNAVYPGTFSDAAADAAQIGWTTDNNAGLGGAMHARVLDAESAEGNVKVNLISEDGKAGYFRFDGTNSAKTTVYTYGTVEGYTMPLKSNTYYQLTADVAGWNQRNKDIVLTVKDANNNEVASQTVRTSATSLHLGTADDVRHFDFKFLAEADGDYTIELTNGSSEDNAVVLANVVIKSSELETANLTLASSGYTSWVTTFDVDFNGLDVEAYIVEPDDIDLDNMKIDMTQIYNAAKGTPVIFKGEPSAQFTLTETVESVADWTETNKLKSGADCGGKIDGDNYGFVWMFSKGKFKRCQNGINLNATKAYLVLDDAILPEGDINFRAVFGDGEANAINGIASETAAPEAIYNLQGQKVNTPVKGGIYIINGKKTLVK